MRNKKDSKERRLSWYIKAPIRLLSKARDLYVRGMNDCSSHLAYPDAAMGCPAVQPLSLPRSFSVGSTTSSASDDFRDLVRAASVREYGNRLVLDPPAPPSNMTVPRSRSVGFGKIDEDKPCDFEDDIKLKPHIYPRSRSHAVRKRAALF